MKLFALVKGEGFDKEYRVTEYDDAGVWVTQGTRHTCFPWWRVVTLWWEE